MTTTLAQMLRKLADKLDPETARRNEAIRQQLTECERELLTR